VSEKGRCSGKSDRIFVKRRKEIRLDLENSCATKGGADVCHCPGGKKEEFLEYSSRSGGTELPLIGSLKIQQTRPERKVFIVQRKEKGLLPDGSPEDGERSCP